MTAKRTPNPGTPLDFLGRTIAVGDTIVYPVRRGAHLWLSKMSVTTIIDKDMLRGTTQSRDFDGRLVECKNVRFLAPYRCVIVEKGTAEASE